MRVGLAVAGLVLTTCGAVGRAQAPAAQTACGAQGYRVVERRWDAVLGKGWEVHQECAHPEWPARTVAVSGLVRASEVGVMKQAETLRVRAMESLLDRPVLVQAGQRVRLWSRDAVVRIEMSGMAESSARSGERVVVRVTRQTEDEGLATEEIAGVVRGAGDVEMER